LNRATTLRETYQVMDPRPLLSGDPFFVDLSAARASLTSADLRRMIENCGEGQYCAIALSGHRGSGKSTELHRLKESLSTSCFTLYLDVGEFLDPRDVDYTDLFLLLCQQLVKGLAEEDIELNSRLIHDVEEWFKSVTEEKQQSVEVSAGVGAEAQAGVQSPFLKLLGRLTASIKAGSSTKKTIRQELDRNISVLLAYANTLLTSASDALRKKRKPSVVLVIVDRLDLLPPDKSETLFFTHGSQLQGLNCHAVYTVPIETYYHHQGIGHVFANHLLLPNVKLRAAKDSQEAHTPGVEGLLEVLRRRMDTSALIRPATVAEEAVLLSGGSVRQLMNLIRAAVLRAQERNIEYLDREAIQDGALAQRHDFERSLVPSDYPLLAQTAASHAIVKDEAYMQLLGNTAVMEYNGNDVWYDVNPLIRPIDAFKTAAAKDRQKASAASRGRRNKRPR
jgi:hypothetical protein